MVRHEWKIEQENGEQVIGTTEYFPKGYDEGTIIGKTLDVLPVCTMNGETFGWFPSRRIGTVVEYLGTVKKSNLYSFGEIKGGE